MDESTWAPTDTEQGRVQRCVAMAYRCHKTFGDTDQQARIKTLTALRKVFGRVPGQYAMPVELPDGTVEDCLSVEGMFIMVRNMHRPEPATQPGTVAAVGKGSADGGKSQ